jgi:glyoxylase I family protein
MAIDLRGMAPLLLVHDMASSLAFYRHVLGFEVVSTSGPDYGPGWALLQRGSAELMVNGRFEPASAPADRDEERAAVHGDTALYFGCRDLDGAYRHLRDHGIELQEPMMTGYGFRSIGLTDPDGYTLIFHWPETPEAREEWARRYG